MVWHYYFTIALSGFINTLFAVLLYARRLPRRKHWGLWLALGVGLGVGVLIGFSYVENALYDGRDESVNLLGVALQQILILAANISIVRLFTRARADVLLLCFVSAVAHARMVADAAGVLESLGVLRFDWFSFDDPAWGFTATQVANWLVYYLIRLTASFGLYCIFGRMNIENKVGNTYLLGMSVCMLFICIAADSVISVYLREGGVVVITLRLVLIICSLFVLLLRREVQRGSAAKTELETAERLIAQQARQYEQSAKNIELINIKCHDLRKQIRNFGGLQAAEAEEIAGIVRIYDSAVKTGNDALDVLLGGYGLRCEAEKVELQCMLEGAALSSLAVSDLYALFGNLLDNALEYLASLAEGDKKFIRLSSLRRGGYYILVAENYFEGELSLDKEGIPVTHKADKQNHGFGIRSIKHIAEKYGGFADVEADCGLFTVRCAFPLDRLQKN